jgi:endonuclease/exonuclease/phosphatase family metal-dependent hydrolase
MKRLKHVALGVWVCLSCLTYASVWVSPAAFWPAAFLAMFGIPTVMVTNLALLFWALVTRQLTSIVFLFSACVLLSTPFWLATVSLNSKPKTITDGGFGVISFNLGKHYVTDNRLKEKKYYQKHINRWLASQKADILLLQEVFNYAIVPEFRILHGLKKAGYKQRFFSLHAATNDTTGSGMAIVARHPLSNKKVCYAKKHSINLILRADCKMPAGTIRLINVHLQSIRLTYDDLNLSRKPRHIVHNLISIAKKMRQAYISRAEQVAVLQYELTHSPYPILLGGDFNDTPYSYTYWKVRQTLTSSFENAGSGMGNTYNGKFKAGLRIDHQFYQKPIKCLRLVEIDSLPYSDHFALEGYYILNAE